MSNFYALINRMKYIRRWCLMRSNNDENLFEHSFQVAVIAHALALIKNKKFSGDRVAVSRQLRGDYGRYAHSRKVQQSFA